MRNETGLLIYSEESKLHYSHSIPKLVDPRSFIGLKTKVTLALTLLNRITKNRIRKLKFAVTIDRSPDKAIIGHWLTGAARSRSLD